VDGSFLIKLLQDHRRDGTHLLNNRLLPDMKLLISDQFINPALFTLV
jgi:hypothetical protein